MRTRVEARKNVRACESRAIKKLRWVKTAEEFGGTAPAEAQKQIEKYRAYAICPSHVGIKKPYRLAASRQDAAKERIVVPSVFRMHCLQGQHVMPKERKSNKETKEQALLTPKERKAAKQAKKQSKAGGSLLS